jgi:serine/threonine protein kinase
MNGESVPLSLQKRVDAACDRFEKAWKGGQGPRIEDHLAEAAETDRVPLFRELLALEIELRGDGGERPTPEEYQRRFAEHIELIHAVFANLTCDADSGPPGSSEGAMTPHTPLADSSAVDPASPLPSGPPPAPDHIGRYQVVRRLGGGAYGDVYLAHDGVMDRQVAIKVPCARRVVTERAREEFLREARSVARLQHEGIVRAYDFGEADGRCYIVYEFIDGESLAERIKPERIAADPLPLDEAARVVAEVAEALHYAHLQEMFHRDVKPSNILLDKKGKPKVADFGLAVREEDLPGERGRRAGTLPYMSPEQVQREGHRLDGRSDVYGLGVVLYELLCGRRPFTATTEDELIDQILHREAKPPRQIKDSIPRRLERVCLKALSKRVQDRYTTAKDMAWEVMRAIESSESSESGPDAAIILREIEGRMASADEDELRRLLRRLQETGDPACVPLVFRCLSHPAEAVRQQARKVVHSLGWGNVSDTAEDMARRDDAAGIAAVLDGLAAFEAHPQIVGLLDRLVVLLKGDLRNRAILLLERKRLGLELDAVAGLFRDIHSPYRIEKVLGQGLFTAAYLAHAEGTDLAVVVRVLRPEFVGQPQLRAQFLDLSKRALQLVHENLVLTREARAFPERQMYFAVRDYVNGVTLQKVLEAGKRFELPQIVRILRRLIGALSAVHRRGMSHGGVKPSNVFVCEENRVVLGDPALPATGVGVALDRLSYDYRYAAPETFRGGGAAWPQADFYSLGCVAYELACGEPPFVSDNYLELAARHLHDAVVPPSRRGSRLGPAGDEVLLKLLARSHADRYAWDEHILRALDRLEAAQRPAPLLRDTSHDHSPPPFSVLRLQGPAPLLRDTSLARFQGTESVLGFDASAVSLPPRPDDTLGPEPSLAPQAPVQPTRVGNYDILGPLGRGGMGVVYKALDPRLQRVVALKVLSAGAVGAAPDERLTRFWIEAQAVARLQDPHIVQIYDIGEHEEQPYIALEYMDGGSLAEKLRTELPTPRAAAETVAKLARAIHHAHMHGVVHRDLKPSNILLTSDGQPKIGDFGLAKMLESPDEEITGPQTRAGMILGTPSYMSPEQAAGEIRMIGPAADIYSLGATLYASLTGRPPFQGENVIGTLSQIATGQVVPPHTLNRAVSPDLSAICLKCLEKDPQMRYSSAQELAEDLERWLAGLPVTARRASSIRRFMRWFRRSLAALFLSHKRA